MPPASANYMQVPNVPIVPSATQNFANCPSLSCFSIDKNRQSNPLMDKVLHAINRQPIT